MKHRKFYKGEEVRVSMDACDKRMRGAYATIDRLHRPIQGQHRYTVSTASGMSTTVVETLLEKILGRWEDCVWQPKPMKDVRRPHGWKRFS
jgi:hypothetical protein